MAKRNEGNGQNVGPQGDGWFDQSGGEVRKWAVGTELLGTFLRLKDGSLPKSDGTGKAKLLVVMVNGTSQVWGVPAILESMLEGFVAGDGIYAKCVGTKATAGSARFGNAAKDFVVKRKPAHPGAAV